MKTHITKGQQNRPAFSLALVIGLLALMVFIPSPAKADLNLVNRFTITQDINSVDADRVFSDIPVISSNELGDMRGGFRVGGLDINIGAIVRTFIDGRLALHSQLTVADDGNIQNSVVSPVSSEITGATIISNDSNGSTLQEATPAGVNLEGMEGSEGVIVNDNRGFTAALQNIRKDRFLTTIVNRASGRSIRHKVNVDVTIKNFTQLQRHARSARLAQRITHR